MGLRSHETARQLLLTIRPLMAQHLTTGDSAAQRRLMWPGILQHRFIATLLHTHNINTLPHTRRINTSCQLAKSIRLPGQPILNGRMCRAWTHLRATCQTWLTLTRAFTQIVALGFLQWITISTPLIRIYTRTTIPPLIKTHLLPVPRGSQTPTCTSKGRNPRCFACLRYSRYHIPRILQR